MSESTPKLTAKQEQFCQEYLKNKCNASEAYRQSYNCEKSSDQVIWNEACVLMHNHDVAIRIQNLQAEAAKRNEVTLDSLTEELNEAKEFAYQEKQTSAAVSAIMGKAKIHGFDKQIIGGDVNHVVKIVNLAGKDD